VNLNFDDTIVTQCFDGSWCCGRNVTNCCEKKAGYIMDDSNGQVTAHNGSAQQPFDPLDWDGPGLSPGPGKSSNKEKIALGVGLGVGLTSIGLLLATLWIRLQRRQRAAEETRRRLQAEDTTSIGNSKAVPQDTYLKGGQTSVCLVELETPIAELYQQPAAELHELHLLEMEDSSPKKPSPNEAAMDKRS
jgi:hypothetical protein